MDMSEDPNTARIIEASRRTGIARISMPADHFLQMVHLVRSGAKVQFTIIPHGSTREATGFVVAFHPEICSVSVAVDEWSSAT